LAIRFKTYLHRTPEIEIEARQYPAALLPHFRQFVDTVWTPEHSRDYFKTRDVRAIAYLPRLLPKRIRNFEALRGRSDQHQSPELG
jgi:hypothetical protein